MRRQACGGCGFADLQVFLDLGLSPLADAFPTSPDQVEDVYPLQVAVCPSCWLVQQMEVVDDRLLFGDDYAYFSGTSPSLVAYFKEYASWALGQTRTPLTKDRLVVEVACNDGTLLAEFAAWGVHTVGVDRASTVAAAARARGLEIVNEPFGVAVAEQVAAAHGRADLLIANNVAAHVPDLGDFFGGLQRLLAPEGTLLLEVQYLGDLVGGNQFDHVYHEHRRFFSVATLEHLLNRHGLNVRAVKHTDAQGGSVRITADRGKHNIVLPDEEWLRRPSTYMAVQGRVERLRDRLLDLVDEQIHAGAKIAGYAASAKSTTLLNFCGLGPDRVDRIEDTTPHKIGRFTPGMKIPIVAPGGQPPPDVYLLLVSNYLPGVLRRERKFIADGGRLLVPIPWPVLL